jgi:hypothetical protein
MIRQVAFALAASLAIASLALTGPVSAESAAVTNYKQQVARIIDTWERQMKAFNDEIMKARADLADLTKKDPRPADYDKQVADLQTKIRNAQASMDFASRSAQVDLGLLEFKPANKSEGDGLPEFIKKIIAAKGIPLSNTVSIPPPDVKWNWKSNTLGSIVLKINITPKGF